MWGGSCAERSGWWGCGGRGTTRRYVRQYRDEVHAAVREEAVKMIQARHRGNAGRRKARRQHEIRNARKRENSATHIQSHFRRRVAARHTHGLRRQRSAVRIQAGYRGSRGRKHAGRLRRERDRRTAAIRVQASFRMSYQRKLYLRAKLFVHGTTRMQALHRGRRERRKFRVALQEHRHQKRVGAATRIQARHRGRFARRDFQRRRLHRHQHRSARLIQDQWRYRRTKRRRHGAALRIQRHWRGLAGRRLYAERRRDHTLHNIRRNGSARCIQGHWRGHKIRKSQEHARRNKAATRLQAAWRGRLGRRRAVRTREERRQEKAAIKITCSFRGLMGRFRAKQRRLLKFSQSIAEVVPQRISKRDREERRRAGPPRLDPDEVRRGHLSFAVALPFLCLHFVLSGSHACWGSASARVHGAPCNAHSSCSLPPCLAGQVESDLKVKVRGRLLPNMSIFAAF